MPIYEFYCPDCNTILSFFSRTVNTAKTPGCPRCRASRLQRQVSLFSATGRAGGESAAGDLPIDESKMERAMNLLAGEADRLDQNDPRQAANLMRKFSDMTGLQMGGNMEAALARLEAGEDPDTVEKEMGDILDGSEEPFILPGQKGRESVARRPPPSRDETLYEM